MAEEPDDLVLRILRDIQSTLSDHTRMHQEHAADFRKVHQEIADLKDTTISAAGLAVHANVKTENLQTQINEMADRLSKLERKVEEKV